MSMKSQTVPVSIIRRQGVADLLSVPVGEPIPVVTQSQIAHILTLREEIRMIREEIRDKELDIGMALRMNGRVESGPHAAELDRRKRVRVLAFRGGIIR
jgi:hypothetical protein